MADSENLPQVGTTVLTREEQLALWLKKKNEKARAEPLTPILNQAYKF
jgi:hypothetical protein